MQTENVMISLLDLRVVGPLKVFLFESFRVTALGSPAIQVFIECIAGSKYMNTSLPRQFASCTREGLVFTGMHKSRYESSLHLICFLPRIKRGTTSTGMTKYHCLLNINNINKLIMQNSVAN